MRQPVARQGAAGRAAIIPAAYLTITKVPIFGVDGSPASVMPGG
jgi:hypothetical protein